MTAEQSVIATALNAWNSEIARADKFFSPLTDAQLQTEIAPGKNRLVYLWGHLIAVHDRMIPLLGVGAQLYPDLEAPFLKEADRAVDYAPSAEELKRWWTEVNAHLHTAFEPFTTADWTDRHTAVSAEDFAKNPLRNRLAVLLSRASHVSYHLGQCQIAPK